MAVGTIVGSVVAGVSAVGLVVFAIFFILGRRPKRVRPFAARTSGNFLDAQPLAMVNSSNVGPRGNVDRRNPLRHDSQRSGASSVERQKAQLYSRSEFGVFSDTQTKCVDPWRIYSDRRLPNALDIRYILPYSPLDQDNLNPYRDLIPPSFPQATAFGLPTASNPVGTPLPTTES